MNARIVKSHLPKPFVLVHWSEDDGTLMSSILKMENKDVQDVMAIERVKENIMIDEFYDYIAPSLWGDKYHPHASAEVNSSVLELAKYLLKD